LVYIIVRIAYGKIVRLLLKRKIEYMNHELKAIEDLKKKAQEERFKQGKISALVYNIRMEKFDSKRDKIKQELPVLESKLKKAVKSKKTRENGIKSDRIGVKRNVNNSGSSRENKKE
jgi:hypothetical protein